MYYITVPVCRGSCSNIKVHFIPRENAQIGKSWGCRLSRFSDKVKAAFLYFLLLTSADKWSTCVSSSVCCDCCAQNSWINNKNWARTSWEKYYKKPTKKFNLDNFSMFLGIQSSYLIFSNKNCARTSWEKLTYKHLWIMSFINRILISIVKTQCGIVKCWCNLWQQKRLL